MSSESCRKKGILHRPRIDRLFFSAVKITKIFLLNLNLSNEIFSTWRRNEFFELSLRGGEERLKFFENKDDGFSYSSLKKKREINKFASHRYFVSSFAISPAMNVYSAESPGFTGGQGITVFARSCIVIEITSPPSEDVNYL